MNLQKPVLQVAIFVVSCFLSGCILPSGGGDSRDVKLSDAMNSSSQGDRHDLGGLHSDSDSSVTVIGGSGTGGGGGGDLDAVSYDKHDYSWQVPLEVGYTVPLNGDIKDIIHFRLTPISFEDERNYFGFYLGGGDVNFEDGSLPDLATKNPWIFEAGFDYHYYLNHSRTGLSPYLAASAGYQLMGWQYLNPIFAGGDFIESDELHGATASVGVGITTRRDSRFSVFAEADFGGTILLGNTWQGFENDVFDNYSFVFVRAGLTIRF
jgi:hypothetical protein